MKSSVVALATAAVAMASQALGQIPTHHHFHGTTAGSNFGISVSGAGDVNGDGHADVIVGATDGSGVSPFVGTASVYSGFDGSLLHTFTNGHPGSAFGAAVSGAGDVDDDGYDDLVVGARYDSTNGTFAGAVYVYSGFDGSLIHDFYGAATGDRLGVSVNGAGDVNSDGKDDVIAGAYFASNNGFWSGSAYVYSGHNGSVLRTLHGQAAFEFFGAAVAGAGDVNGDGRHDVIVGAYGNDTGAPNGGAARVFSGLNGALLHAFYGTTPQGSFGASVDGAGDVNHDGRADLIAGAWLADTVNGSGSGQAVVYSGLDGTVLHTIDGDDAHDHFGFSVAGAGDVNGDGTPDFVIGAYFDENHGTASGSARVVSGLDGTPLRTFNGDSPDDRFGISVSGAGDVNGDGLDDVVSGAYLDDDGGIDAGSARVLTVCGTQPYGTGSGGSVPPVLHWTAGPVGAASSGSLHISGGAAFGVGGLAISVGEATVPLGGLTVLVDITPGAWLFLPLTLNGVGAAVVPLELRQVALDGLVFRAQALVAVSSPALSNGLRILLSH